MAAFPPRFGHLVLRRHVVARLAATYAASHEIDEVEAGVRLDRGYSAELHERLLSATWAVWQAKPRPASEEKQLARIDEAMQAHPFRPARAVTPTAAWSALLLAIDVNAGFASMAARGLLESPEGQAGLSRGLADAGAWLARELLR